MNKWSMELQMMNHSSLPSNLRSCFNNNIFKHHQLLELAQRWKAEMQKTSLNGQDSSKPNLVHVVQDLPMENSQVQSNQKLYSCGTYSSSNVVTTMTSRRIEYARTTGYFLVMPLIAFCIRCMMITLHHRVFGEPKQTSENDLDANLHTIPNSKRWKSALGDFDPDTKDFVSRPDSGDFADGDHQLHDEDAAKAYMEVERDYQKFLSECGMNTRGYRRGGSS